MEKKQPSWEGDPTCAWLSIKRKADPGVVHDAAPTPHREIGAFIGAARNALSRLAHVRVECVRQDTGESFRYLIVPAVRDARAMLLFGAALPVATEAFYRDLQDAALSRIIPSECFQAFDKAPVVPVQADGAGPGVRLNREEQCVEITRSDFRRLNKRYGSLLSTMASLAARGYEMWIDIGGEARTLLAPARNDLRTHRVSVGDVIKRVGVEGVMPQRRECALSDGKKKPMSASLQTDESGVLKKAFHLDLPVEATLREHKSFNELVESKPRLTLLAVEIAEEPLIE